MEIRFNQSDFSAGQLSPKVAARDDYIGYYKGAKRLENCIVLPQGGVSRRFGTSFIDTITSTNPDYTQLGVLTYDDNTTYLLLWEALSIKIYLHGTLNATVVTPYAAEDIKDCRFAQAGLSIVAANENFAPYALTRSQNSANNITGFSGPNDTLTIATALTQGVIYPARFQTGGLLPTTSPQIYTLRTYFVKAITTTTIRIYENPEDAENDENYFVVMSAGAGASLLLQNTWAFAAINFIQVPSYDFSGNYGAVTFTPAATSGNGVNLQASSAIFSLRNVGGYFRGNGGAMRITGFVDAQNVTGNIEDDFLDTDPIPGDDAYLAEPAWSASRGYPRAVSVFEQRLVFGGSRSIPNGVWLSFINQFYNFNDATVDDDNAISWYPASGGPNYVQAITSARTLLVHTNSGTYSTPVGNDLPLTPSNFTLVEQNKDGVSSVQPVFIDNQVIYIDKALANAKNLIFDIIRGTYVLNNISVASSNLLVSPKDMDAFVDPEQTDGSYVLIINSDGTLAIFQTLYEQNIAAWTFGVTSMSDAKAYFRHVICATNDAWFIVERPVNGVNRLYIEKLDFDTNLDCTKRITLDPPSATITGLGYLEGQSVYVFADGALLQPQVVTGGQIVLTDPVSEVILGLNYVSTMTMLPVGSLQGVPTNLYKPMHVRVLYVQYYQTLGGSVAGAQLQTEDLEDLELGALPEPQDGVFQLKLMGGWNMLDYDIEIQQPLPLPMTILGVGYVLEVP